MTKMLLCACVVLASTNIVAAQDAREHLCAAKSAAGSALVAVMMFITTERPDNAVVCRYADNSTVELVRGRCELPTVDLFAHGPRGGAVASGYHECNADANDPRRCRVLCRAPS